MTYIPNKPDTGKSPKLDASKIKNNFSIFQTVFGKDHVPLNTANQGDHSTIIFTARANIPVTPENGSVLYSRQAPSKAGIQPQLFLRPPDFLPTNQDSTTIDSTPMQLTYNTVNLTAPIFQSFLIGGYFIYFGSVSGMTAGIDIKTVDVVILVPAPTKLIFAQAAPNTVTSSSAAQNFTIAVQLNTTTNDRFTVTTSGNNRSAIIAYSFTWMAIGTV